MKAELEQVGREVSSVLETARLAAEAMRERAAAEAARWRSEAIAECETELRQARSDAEQLRSDAWATAEEMLKQSQREASHTVDEAKAEGLRLQGESEREAHKVTSAARRQADDLVRNARMESERLIVSAQAKHDEIIETANRLAETAQERTRALEQRRDELKEELDTVRQAMSSMEAAMDERREAMGLSPGSNEEPEERTPGEDWVPGETVRVVRPEASAEQQASRDVDIAQVLQAPEVKVIPAAELAARMTVDEPLPQQPEQVERESPATDEPSTPESVSVAEPERSATESESDVAVEAPPPARSFDELTGLFDKLRRGDEEDDPASAIQPDDASTDEAGSGGEVVETRHVGASEEEVPDETATESQLAAEQPTPAARSSVPDIDPFEMRDQLLLPVSNRALRNLKRQLAEEGNVALEELHLKPEEWMPEAGEVHAKVRADLLVLHAESFGAGHAAVEQMTGSRLSRPPTPKVDVATEFAGDLTEDLEHALEEGRHAGQGALQLKAGVSRVFRAWRTDESERRMRAISLAAFNAGVMATVDQNDLASVKWVVAGRGCAVCRSSAEEGVTEAIPPAHDGCECVIIPV